MSNDAAREVVAAESSPNPPDVPNPTHLQVSAWGAREASSELYDACLRIVEVATAIEGEIQLPNKLYIQLMTTRLCAQQALDHARRLS